MKKALIVIGILIGIFVLSIVAASLQPEGVLAYPCGCDAPAGVTTGCECTVSCGEQTACGNTVRCGFDCGGGNGGGGGGDGGGGQNPPPAPQPTNTPIPTPTPIIIPVMGVKVGALLSSGPVESIVLTEKDLIPAGIKTKVYTSQMSYMSILFINKIDEQNNNVQSQSKFDETSSSVRGSNSLADFITFFISILNPFSFWVK